MRRFMSHLRAKGGDKSSPPPSPESRSRLSVKISQLRQRSTTGSSPSTPSRDPSYPLEDETISPAGSKGSEFPVSPLNLTMPSLGPAKTGSLQTPESLHSPVQPAHESTTSRSDAPPPDPPYLADPCQSSETNAHEEQQQTAEGLGLSLGNSTLLLRRMGQNQGDIEVCWSYGIGNAIARGAQRRYGVLLNPESIVDRLTGELRCFGVHFVARVLRYLEERWADPLDPFILHSLEVRAGRLVPAAPVSLYLTDVTAFGPQEIRQVEGRTGWYHHDPTGWDEFCTAVAKDPSLAAVVSLWRKEENTLRADGHAVSFEALQGELLVCKNSSAVEPVLYVGKHNFKGAVSFRVHVCHVLTGGVTGRYGCHALKERGGSLPPRTNRRSGGGTPNGT